MSLFCLLLLWLFPGAVQEPSASGTGETTTQAPYKLLLKVIELSCLVTTMGTWWQNCIFQLGLIVKGVLGAWHFDTESLRPDLWAFPLATSPIFAWINKTSYRHKSVLVTWTSLFHSLYVPQYLFWSNNWSLLSQQSVRTYRLPPLLGFYKNLVVLHTLLVNCKAKMKKKLLSVINLDSDCKKLFSK